MADKVLQGVVLQVRDTIGRNVGLIDEQGMVIVSSDVSRLGQIRGEAAISVGSNEIFVSGGDTYRAIDRAKNCGAAVFVQGTDPEAAKFAGLVLIALENVKQVYDERYDKCNFVKNVVMDNIMPGDIYTKARELHLATDVSRVAVLLRVQPGAATSAYDMISTLFPEKNRDFVFNISETDTVLIKELKPGVESKDIENLASSIVDMLENDHLIKAAAGIGTRVVGVKDLANSFKEAQMALEVGKVFYTEQNIVNYENLGIARLIYHLPTTLCEMFLKEVFKRGSIDSLDQETLFTIQHFFENNLNVSETSRGLFVHRNTLVYRLEKIRKLTGLDLRNFEDAIVFKVALMVKKYLDANPTKY